MPHRGRTTAQQAAIEHKEEQAWALAVAGATLTQIAKALGYRDCSGASKALKRARARHAASLQKSVAERRDEENARLDSAQVAIWPQVKAGNLRAIDAYVKLSKLRCDINGVFPATKHEVSGAGGGPLQAVTAVVDLDELERIAERNRRVD